MNKVAQTSVCVNAITEHDKVPVPLTKEVRSSYGFRGRGRPMFRQLRRNSNYDGSACPQVARVGDDGNIWSDDTREAVRTVA